MDQNNLIECGGFFFIHNFDSGNLGHVERVPTELIVPSIINHKTNAVETPDYEFNLWTRPDCAGTNFENGNRTWFYFGVQASEPNVLVRLNLINLNKQGKMYTQGMAPVTRTLPGKPQWERIRDRPVHSLDDNTFTLSFKYRTSDNVKATTFFAFTYPFSFSELQITLNSIDMKMLPLPPPQSLDDIYYCRECLVYSLEGRRVDLLTITSHHGITEEREDRLRNLFPEDQERPFKFKAKKIIFISARVHPGETPSSFVFNGFLNLILNRSDPIAIQLRRLYVFKMIPFLNPDGVARGHYRTDTRGVNLNRVYYHFGCEKEDSFEDSKSVVNETEGNQQQQKKKKGTKDTKRPVRSAGSDKATAASADTTDRQQCKDRATEAANLADQVCDMSLHDMSLQTNCHSSSSKEDLEPLSSPNDQTRRLEAVPSPNDHVPRSCAKDLEGVMIVPSLLDDQVLRSCLGSAVHLSTSEEMRIQGKNPLTPLRDSLKNSISLLMGGSSSVAGDSGAITEKVSMQSNIKMGICSACLRRTAQKLNVSGHINTALRVDYGGNILERSEPRTYESIEEYRECQRRQIEHDDTLIQETADTEMETETQRVEAQSADKLKPSPGIYICTNCFQRFQINEDHVEVMEQSVSPVSMSQLSVGESGDVQQLATPSESDTTKPREPRRGAPTTRKKKAPAPPPPPAQNEQEGNLFLYIDLHGHASKKGIFMYGNHFEDLESSVECMLLPRIMSLNNLHFHFSSCNFTERNMYLRDRRDGMSREGSGRVAVLKATGLVRSYTLECNYNTGRLVNVLPPAVRDPPTAQHHAPHPPAPPKYTPHIFEEVNPFQDKRRNWFKECFRNPYCRPMNLEVCEDINPYEVGRSLGASILDLTGHHPNSRIPCSDHRTLAAVRDWLRAHTRISRPMINMPRIQKKPISPTRVPIYARSKPKVIEERKENAYAGAKTDTERKRSPPVLNQRSQHEIISVNMKYVKKTEPTKSASRTKCLTENEPKPKTMAVKRRSILGIRKPNTSKTQVSGVVKARVSRRSIEDTSNPRQVKQKLSKRSFSRSVRGVNRSNCRREMASSSSDDTLAWEELQATAGPYRADPIGASKRRPYSTQPPALLKKIRLKTGL